MNIFNFICAVAAGIFAIGAAIGGFMLISNWAFTGAFEWTALHPISLLSCLALAATVGWWVTR